MLELEAVVVANVKLRMDEKVTRIDFK